MKVNIALLTVTDTRTLKNDKSGSVLVNKIAKAKHNLIERKICKDNKKDIKKIIKKMVKKEKIRCNNNYRWNRFNWQRYNSRSYR